MPHRVALGHLPTAATASPVVPPVWRAALPALTLAAYGAALAYPPTHDAAVALVQENRPVELATFGLLVAAGVVGLWHVWFGIRRLHPAWVRAVHAAFALAMLVVAGEEVAWGQWFLGFSTPEAVAAVNAQGELTLHNLGPLQGRSELFRLAFAAAGLFGVWLGRHATWHRIAAPRTMLPLLVTILAASVLDVHADTVDLAAYDRGWRWTSEVVELLIGVAALMYVLPLRPRDRVRPAHG